MAQEQWHIRHTMRHLVEVMLVLEGKQPWARALRERRREQGLTLPVPCVRSDDDDVDDVLHGWLRVMVEGPMDKEIMRLIVSFI